jgi:hypothetical protein
MVITFDEARLNLALMSGGLLGNIPEYYEFQTAIGQLLN